MERIWFYARGQQKTGPVPESELKSLIAAGTISGDDLVWTEGMAAWTKASTVPELQAAPAESAVLSPTPDAVLPRPARVEFPAVLPEGLLGWMSFVGVMNIIYGALNCLSCVGIITGIFFIMSGAALVAAKKLLADAKSMDPSLAPFFVKLKSFFLMTGIVYVLALVMIVVMGIVYAGIIATVIAGAVQAPTPP